MVAWFFAHPPRTIKHHTTPLHPIIIIFTCHHIPLCYRQRVEPRLLVATAVIAVSLPSRQHLQGTLSALPGLLFSIAISHSNFVITFIVRVIAASLPCRGYRQWVEPCLLVVLELLQSAQGKSSPLPELFISTAIDPSKLLNALS